MNATDDAFGPRLEGAFDFTLLFEQSIFSILPSAVLICVAAARIGWLRRKDVKVRAGMLLGAKLGTAGIQCCLQLVTLVLWSVPNSLPTRASIPASALSLIASGAVGALFYIEHRRSTAPSKILSGYLFLTILLDVAQARTLFQRAGLRSLAAIFVTSLSIKLVLLLLEEVPKRSLLAPGLKETTSVEKTSGPLSRTVFWWLNSLFRKGFGDILSLGDLSIIQAKFTSRQLQDCLGAVWDKCNKQRKHCLTLATFRAFSSTCAITVLPRLCLSALRFAQPFLIQRIITFVGEPPTTNSSEIASGLIGATALVYIGMAVTRAYYQHLNFQLTTMIRGGLVALIFQKTLELDSTKASEGDAISLISADIEGIEPGISLIHEVWASIIELGIALYLLERQVGAACFFVIIPAAGASMLTSQLMKAMRPARMSWGKAIKERVSASSNMLAQIKSLKTMGLTSYMSTSIQNLRVAELDVSRKFRLALIRILTTGRLADQMTPVVIIAGAVFWTKRTEDQELSVAEVFSALAIISLVSSPISQLISCLPNAMASIACFDRIQEYLLEEEIGSSCLKPSKSHDNTDFEEREGGASGLPLSASIELTGMIPHQSRSPSSPAAVIVKDGFYTPADSGSPILQGINLSVSWSSCVMIAGPIGSGKTTLLKIILGEKPLSKGSIQVDRNQIAYCNQTPWLRNISVRDNIVSPNLWDDLWFATVVRACALDKDLSLLPNGDQTLVGSGGVALSGGQKQRVALARAVYSHKSILILDDVLSALDNATGSIVFERLLGKEGILRSRDITVVLATHSVHYLPASDAIIVLAKDGQIAQQGTFGDLKNTDGYVRDLALEQIARAKAMEDEDTTDGAESKPKVEAANENSEALDLKRQTGDISLYTFYFKSVSWFLAVFWLALAILYTGLSKIPDVWIRIWAEQGMNNNSGYYFGSYFALSFSSVLASAFSVSFFMLVIVPKSAQHLHWLFLESVMKAPLWFFTTTDSGVTLNRFAQDMTLLDNRLPVAVYHTIYDVLFVLLSTALIAAGAQYVAAVIPFSVIALYLLAKYYLRTSRQIRYLDLEAKTPLFTLLTETIDGLSTIRAFGWRRSILEESFRLLDGSQKPYYLLFCIQRWLTVVLDLFIAAIAVILVAFAVKFRNTTTQGAIGVAMVNILGLNTELSELVNNWADLETSLGAIARLRSFLQDTPKEDDPGRVAPADATWPSQGRVDLKGLSAAYRANDNPVLRNVSLSVLPGQKIGICGRTGSGKSSLILTILRLLEIESGAISIDGVDLSTVSRESVRTRIITLPQDPVKLSGTVRQNLIPGEAASSLATAGGNEDERLESALTRVDMWDLIRERGGLDADFGDMELSQGQRQLFCLARAILRRNDSTIVLLDEPTSSIDRETDERVMKVIREDFKHCTVIAVAHRLETILDSDVIAVMDAGKIQEIGEPKALLGQADSRFKALWDSRNG
ncbi:hypothetical protein PFICI_13925 [Pestalotiopsis fici W106-1]|uniref:ABC transporter n=1 Tax=Pestalotiopsis fici (strain W106-1 / CGMCC3.15140) TaxID=1229662 RepID=W3WJV9_PESFW|nr:uncharacterized protein PFICI_13925 [Pestalotiopsis fici W106-1]ETS74059.1 hypothetical protein PFICI_13925 [Pestalotiopsis fici W106-1]